MHYGDVDRRTVYRGDMPLRPAFTAKLVFLPVAYLAASGAVIVGATFIAFGRPVEKLVGLGLIAGALVTFALSLWITFGRPSQWFPPGENTDSRF